MEIGSEFWDVPSQEGDRKFLLSGRTALEYILRDILSGHVAYISRGLMNKGGAMLAWGIYAVAMFLNIYYKRCKLQIQTIYSNSDY